MKRRYSQLTVEDRCDVARRRGAGRVLCEDSPHVEGPDWMDPLSTPRNFCEILPLNRVALLVWVVLDLGAIAAAIWMLTSDRWGGFIGLTFGAFALTATLLVFRRLQVRVDAGGVAARFGPFDPTLAHADIARATPMRYPLRVYLGWGIRGGIGGRRWAYTSAFCTDGVELERRNGQRYYFSSRRPRELADAVEAWAEVERG